MNLEELKRQLPLFGISEINENGYGRMITSRSCSIGYTKTFESLHKAFKEHYRCQQALLLRTFFPNIYFSVYDDSISMWVNRNNSDGEAISYKNITMKDLEKKEEIEQLEELNKSLEPIAKEPDKYFYCFNCGKVKPKTEYADFIMADTYCKECAKIPTLAKAIAQTHERGFYD